MNVITNNDRLCTRALTALETVDDPEIGLNVVDLGLIYQLDFEESTKDIFVSMTLTTQFCPMGSSITDAVSAALAAAFPGYAVKLDLVFDPAWNSDRISKAGMEFLNQ